MPTAPPNRLKSADTLREYVIDLYLTAEQMQSFYAGRVRQVSARDRYGRRIQFPVSVLRPYVDKNGVRGRFLLEVDANSKLKSIQRTE
jgi:hypothetical protein